MKRNLFIRTFALVIAILMLFSACGKTDGPVDGSSESAGTNAGVGDANDIMSIPMPTRDLSNNDKVLTVFSWTSMQENNFDGVAASYFEKEFGVKIEVTIVNQFDYWADYAKMVAAGNAPDIIDTEYFSFWPLPVTRNLYQPWDNVIDFSTPLWADVQDLLERYKWDGNTYYPILGRFVPSFLYYNKAMFKNYGLEDKTPRKLYENDEWTLENLLYLANQFVEKNNKNEITQHGLVHMSYEPIRITGVPVFEFAADGASYTNNLKDPKIAKLMNGMQSISPGMGTGAWSERDCNPMFTSGKAAMAFAFANNLTDGVYADFMNDDILGIAPYPKLDNESPYYCTLVVDPGYGLSNVEGVNKELAGLYIEYLKWFKLGENICREIPTTVNNPAKEKYNLKPISRAAYISEEDTKFIMDYLNDEKVVKTYNDYQGILTQAGGDVGLFKDAIFYGYKPWSSYVEELYPKYEGILKSLSK